MASAEVIIPNQPTQTLEVGHLEKKILQDKAKKPEPTTHVEVDAHPANRGSSSSPRTSRNDPANACNVNVRNDGNSDSEGGGKAKLTLWHPAMQDECPSVFERPRGRTPYRELYLDQIQVQEVKEAWSVLNHRNWSFPAALRGCLEYDYKGQLLRVFIKDSLRRNRCPDVYFKQRRAKRSLWRRRKEEDRRQKEMYLNDTAFAFVHHAYLYNPADDRRRRDNEGRNVDDEEHRGKRKGVYRSCAKKRKQRRDIGSYEGDARMGEGDDVHNKKKVVNKKEKEERDEVLRKVAMESAHEAIAGDARGKKITGEGGKQARESWLAGWQSKTQSNQAVVMLLGVRAIEEELRLLSSSSPSAPLLMACE